MSAKQQIRVFLSSTFADMQEERDYLVKKIFPSIKAECRRRGVDFVALDLRWGINEEAAKSGKVVEICMDEIVRSRPFFIGLLGGRYGTIPHRGDGSITERLLFKYPWIEKCVNEGLSITEMEMQFGVLNNPEPVNAYFFQKNEAFIPRRFREKPGTEQAEKLDALKTAVKAAAEEGKCSLVSYASLKSLGQQVHDALMAKINELYPQDVNVRYSVYSLRQSEFLERRRKVYVNYDDVPEFKGMTLVLGASGSGKSALVANHASNGMQEGSLLVYTVVNSDVNSAEMCIRMLLHELSLQVEGFDLSALNQPLDVPVDLQKIFQDAGFYGKVRWVIDGIDKLLLDNDKSAAWLANLPAQVFEIILTASHADQINNTVLKEYELKEVHGLKPGEILEITKKYLKEYSKALSDVQESHISNSPLLKNPETLMVFLEELLQFGVYEKLDEFVENYLSVDTVENFYHKVLERMDADFGFMQMKDVFSYLILCKFGIDEETLINLLKLNNIEWVAIYTAILPFVSVSGSYLSMDDLNMSAAARKHYDISSVEKNRRFVKKLARVIRDDSAKLKKNIGKRVLEKDGYWEYFANSILTFLFEGYFGIAYESSLQEEERFHKNKYSALNLYANAGMLRKSMKLLVNGGFLTLMTYNKNSFPILRKILQHPRNHMSELLTYRLVIVSRIIKEMPIVTIYSGVFALYSDQERKEKEMQRWMRKMKLLPFSREQVSQCKAFVTNGVTGDSLEKVLEREDPDEVMMDIIYNLTYPFFVESDSELSRIAEKAAAVAAKLTEDDTLGVICSLIASSCYMRLGDPKAKDYMIRTVKESVNISVFAHVYDIYELFEVVINCDVEAYKRLYEKILPYRNNDVGLEQRNVCYAVLLVRPYFVREKCDSAGVLIDEYIKGLRSVGAAVSGSLNRMGMWLYNMKMYAPAYEVFLRAASEYEEIKYSDRISAYRRAARASKNKKLYDQAYSCLKQALEIKKAHMNESSGISLFGICDELESVCRESNNYTEALFWAEMTIEELKLEKKINWLSEAYNVLSINATRLTLDENLPIAERTAYFQKAYDAACESERWSKPDDSGTVVVNRAFLVFGVAGEIDEARLLVDEHVRILERILAVPGHLGTRLGFVCETLANGYLLIEDWAGLKKLQDKYDLRRPHIFKQQLHILYLGNEDREEALNDTMRLFTDEIYKGNGITVKRFHEEVAEMGIADLLSSALLENAEQDEALPRLKRYYAAKSLADARGDHELSEKAMRLICSVFINEDSAFEFYDAFCWRTPLAEYLDAEGMAEEDISRREISHLVSEISSSNRCGLVDDALFRAMKTSAPLYYLVIIAEAVKDSGNEYYINEFLLVVYEQLEKIKDILKTSDSELAARFRDSVLNLAPWFVYDSYTPTEDDVNRSYHILKGFSLPCNPYILAWIMINSQGDDAQVVQLWNENPECHNNPYCQAQYLQALEWQGRTEEVAALAEGYLQSIENDAEKIPVARRYIIALRNLGRYEDSLSVYGYYAERCGEENFIYLKDMILAYTGKSAEALLTLEKNWKDTHDYCFMKAIILLKQGLLQDAERTVEGLSPSLEEGRKWVSVLYLIELARYWKNAGDESKAKGYISEARKFMSTSRLRMCEYEADQLGLD